MPLSGHRGDITDFEQSGNMIDPAEWERMTGYLQQDGGRMVGTSAPRAPNTTENVATGPGSGASGGGYGNDPDSIMARITREQWEEFNTYYRPNEDKLIDIAQQGSEKETRRAGGLMAGAHRNQQDQFQRQVRRMGVGLSDGASEGLARRALTAKSADVAGAQNTMRSGIKDRNENLLANLVSLSKGIGSTASAGMSQAAGLQAGREANNAAAKAQQRASNMQALGTIASIFI